METFFFGNEEEEEEEDTFLLLLVTLLLFKEVGLTNGLILGGIVTNSVLQKL